MQTKIVVSVVLIIILIIGIIVYFDESDSISFTSAAVPM